MTLAEAIAQLNTSRHEMFNQWGAGIIYHAASQAVIYNQTGKKYAITLLFRSYGINCSTTSTILRFIVE